MLSKLSKSISVVFPVARRPSSGKLSFFRGSSREPVPVSRPEVIDTVRYIPKPDALLKESPCGNKHDNYFLLYDRKPFSQYHL